MLIFLHCRLDRDKMIKMFEVHIVVKVVFVHPLNTKSFSPLQVSGCFHV